MGFVGRCRQFWVVLNLRVIDLYGPGAERINKKSLRRDEVNPALGCAILTRVVYLMPDVNLVGDAVSEKLALEPFILDTDDITDINQVIKFID